MNAVLGYGRISTEDQSEYSLIDQKAKIVKHCESKNYNLVEYFEDDGASAKTFNRKSFIRLLAFIKKNKGVIKKVVFVKYDRYSRDLTLGFYMFNELKSLGVYLDAVEQPIDWSVPEATFFLAIYLAGPQVDNERRSLNTANGMRRGALEGRHMGNAPYGYINSRDHYNKATIKPHFEKSEFVIKAFKMLASGMWQIEPLRKQLRLEGMNVSKSYFYTIFLNPRYCGKIPVKASLDEPAILVNGQHKPLISEELFWEANSVLTGKKRTKYKYSLINDSYPLKGHLLCTKCGKPYYGDTGKGNGGAYDFYRCKRGCKEAHSAPKVNDKFVEWLNDISIKPEVSKLYSEVMEDIFKKNEGDRKSEISKIQSEIKKNDEFLAKARVKFVQDILDKSDYESIKSNIEQSNCGWRNSMDAIISVEGGYQNYCNYGFSLISNLGYYYTNASTEVKAKFIGLTFPEKLQFSENSFQTISPNIILTLLSNDIKGLAENKKGQISENANLSSKVTASGFKPETPSSVVRYSIQLSYAAIPFSNLSQKGLQIYLKILFFQRFCLFLLAFYT